MNIYLINQTICNDYDTYDSAVVFAKSEESAKTIHPYSWEGQITRLDGSRRDDWADHPKDVTATYLGKNPEQKEEKVICSSFNAA